MRKLDMKASASDRLVARLITFGGDRVLPWLTNLLPAPAPAHRCRAARRAGMVIWALYIAQAHRRYALAAI